MAVASLAVKTGVWRGTGHTSGSRRRSSVRQPASDVVELGGLYLTCCSMNSHLPKPEEEVIVQRTVRFHIPGSFGGDRCHQPCIGAQRLRGGRTFELRRLVGRNEMIDQGSFMKCSRLEILASPISRIIFRHQMSHTHPNHISVDFIRSSWYHPYHAP
jgi:hypothetical protein